MFHSVGGEKVLLKTNYNPRFCILTSYCINKKSNNSMYLINSSSRQNFC